MRTRYLLDTSICIYIHRERPAPVLARFEHLMPGDAAISVITWGELLYGAAKSGERMKALSLLEEFTGLVPVLDLPVGAGGFYGSVRAQLETGGRTIGNNDLWIAAHACAAELTIVTNNVREFEGVPGLRVENWVSDG